MKKQFYNSEDSKMDVKNIIEKISQAAEKGERVDGDSISEELEKLMDYKKLMSKQTPIALLDYKKKLDSTKNASKILEAANTEINNSGIVLPTGSLLFHGGSLWNDSTNSIITERPLSTTLNLETACYFMNTNKAKSRKNMFILTIKDYGIKSFVYNNKTKHSNEKEILLQAGIELILMNERHIKTDYNDFYIVEADIRMP